MALTDPKPLSKDSQVGTGRPKKYRRKVASPKQWAAIRAEKLTGCRLCEGYGGKIVQTAPLQLHHLLSRAQHGDDVTDNLVCLCEDHHVLVTSRLPATLALLAGSLTNGEHAYLATKCGEDFAERLFGVTYQEAT